MAYKFSEIKDLIARNCRVNICMVKDQVYENYLLKSDIPDGMYDNYYIYGIGIIESEFPMDVYADPKKADLKMDFQHIDFKPAIEIVLSEKPRSDSSSFERTDISKIIFKDLKPYLDKFRNITITRRGIWENDFYEIKSDITTNEYENAVVYGIGMEVDNSDFQVDNRNISPQKERLVIVLA